MSDVRKQKMVTSHCFQQPCLVIALYNHVSSNKWQQVRNELHTHNIKVNVVKNRIALQAIPSVSHMLKGPTCVFSFVCPSSFRPLFQVMKTHPEFILLGAQYKRLDESLSCLTLYDMNRMVTLLEQQKTPHRDLLHVLNSTQQTLVNTTPASQLVHQWNYPLHSTVGILTHLANNGN